MLTSGDLNKAIVQMAFQIHLITKYFRTALLLTLREHIVSCY